MNDLFTPLTVGPLELPNRVLMAPLTRACAEPGHVPGLLIAEATMVMEGNSAFWHEPGIHSAAQVAGWRLTTEAVHAAGGTQPDRHHRRRGAHPRRETALRRATGAGR
ncbi:MULTISPECIES: hypothetical protein [unclassified Cyanobium]|uniref:oxidoreductase n=1 Tax=unclassified Cyanobium TaxID=2627006 RepID=UPI0020CCA661|nr:MULTISPECIES: hypothetical protein [unclassified Cyanobium]